MPLAAKVYCKGSSTCPHEAGRCPVHQHRVQGHGWDTAHGQNVHRIRGRRLQRLRAALFAAEPWCRACRVNLAEIRDHIVPIGEGGTDDPANIQPLCVECSDRKTHEESRRAQR